ncbi:MAG: alpha-L-fucosidase [Actinomycetota bacterium]
MTDGFRSPGLDEWFIGAGFGVFVHWDHASQQGLETSWPLTGGISVLPSSWDVPVEQYHQSAATFDPVNWDPAAFARRVKDAGATYLVFTTKHHSGYVMWDTETTDWSIMHSPYGKDIVGPLADALRAEGLRVGFYFSLCDWHEPTYPPFAEEHKPYVLGSSPPLSSEEDAEKFRAYLKAQLTEILTKYGQVDELWFDGGWERPVPWWQPKELEELIRGLQPNIVINDRLYGVRDFETPEQFVPPKPLPGPWETCMTMNDSWGWVPGDTNYKSSTQIIHTLCEIVGKGGNFLLNVSPMGDGSIPDVQVERLDAVTRWMAKHREAVVGVTPGLEPWQFYGPSTRRDGRVYAIAIAKPYESVTVRGIPVKRVKAVTALGTGSSLSFKKHTAIMESFLPDPSGELTIFVPESDVDEFATVIAIDFDGDL